MLQNSRMHSLPYFKYEESKIPIDLDEADVENSILLEESKVLVVTWSRISLKRYDLRENLKEVEFSGFTHLPGIIGSNLLKLSDKTFCLIIRISRNSSRVDDLVQSTLHIVVLDHNLTIQKSIRLPWNEEYQRSSSLNARTSIRQKSKNLYRISGDLVCHTSLTFYFIICLKSQKCIYVSRRKMSKKRKIRHRVAPISPSLILVRYSTRIFEVIEIRDVRLPSRAQMIMYPPAETIAEMMLDTRFENQEYGRSTIHAIRKDAFNVCLLNYHSRKIVKTHKFERKIQYFNLLDKEAIMIPENNTHIVRLDLYSGVQKYIPYVLDARIYFRGRHGKHYTPHKTIISI
jgi:hypothetical protein